MADILVFWGPHWMESATVHQLSEAHLGKQYREKVESRLQRGDICTVGRDGQYVHAKLKKLRCIQVSDFPSKEAAALTCPLERPRTSDERAGDTDEEERLIAAENSQRRRRQRPLMGSDEVTALREGIRQDQAGRRVMVRQKSRYIDVSLLDDKIVQKLDAREPVRMTWAQFKSLIFIKGV